MGFIVQTLPSIEGVLSSHLSFLLPLLEQALLLPTVEAFSAFFAILVVIAPAVVVV